MKNKKTNLNAIDQRLYTYRQALYLAFYSNRLYIDVAKRWRGFGLSYFFLVIALAVFPFSIKSTLLFHDYLDQQLIQPLQKIPYFEIKQNKLIFDYFMPYVIKNNSGEVLVVFDEERNLTEINYLYPKWMLFITSDRYYMRSPELPFMRHIGHENEDYRSKQVSMQLFSELGPGGVFSGKTLVEQVGFAKMKWYFLPVIYCVLTGFLYGLFSILFLFLAILARVTSHAIFKFRISFKNTYRLLMVSSSAAVMVFVLSLSFGELPFMGVCLLIGISIYFSYAILSVKRESKQMVIT